MTNSQRSSQNTDDLLARIANVAPGTGQDEVTVTEDSTDVQATEVPRQPAQPMRFDPILRAAVPEETDAEQAAAYLMQQAEQTEEYQEGQRNLDAYRDRRARENAIREQALAHMAELREFCASKLSISETKRDHYLTMLSLWNLSNYSYRASGLTAYLYVIAKKRGAGKSQVGKLAYVLAPNPTKLLNPQVATPAVLADFFEEGAVTLFDESDKLTAGEAKELSALLNLGNVKGGSRYRMKSGKNGGRIEQGLFAPKVVMGIARDGSLPFPSDTMSRGIVLEMEPCTQEERRRIGRFSANFLDYRDADDVVALRTWMQEWSLLNYSRIKDDVPELPELQGFRGGEVVEPLVTLADLLGGDWPERIRAALVFLDSENSATSQDEDPTDAFKANVAAVVSDYRQAHPGAEFISGADLHERFKALSAERLTPIGLGKRIGAYKVQSSVKKIAGKVTRGYFLDDLARITE